MRPCTFSKRISLCFKALIGIFILPLLNNGAAYAQDFKVEFSNLARVLPWENLTGTLSDGGVIFCNRNESIKPGERWFETVVKLDTGISPTENTLLHITVSGKDIDKPIGEIKQPVTSDRALVRVDMRQPGRQKLRINARWLSDSGEVLGTGELWASAADIKPLEPGTRIPLKIDLPEGAKNLDNYPVRFGLPLPEGAIWEADGLKVVDVSGKELPSQLEIAGRWAEDGAVKWMWVDALVSGGAQDIYVVAGERTAASNPSSPVKVEKRGDGFVIDTGAAQYVVGADGALIKEARLGGKVVVKEGSSKGLYVIDQKSRLAKASAQDAKIKIESTGPVSAVIRVEGFYATAQGEELANHITRLKFTAGRPEVEATHTLVLINDTNDVWFKDIGWEFEVSAGANLQALFNLSRSNPQEIKTLPVAGNTTLSMLQKEGINMGMKPAGLDAAPGYQPWNRTPPTTSWSTYFYGEPLSVISQDGRIVHSGGEMGDWAALTGAGGGLMVSCRDAAAQHPKEFEVAAGRVTLKLYSPAAGKELDFRMESLMKNWGMIPKENIEGGDEVPQEVLENYLNSIKRHRINAAGWAKTHELVFMPFAQAEGLGETSLLHARQVFAHINPYWIRKTEALGAITPKDEKNFPEPETLIGAYFGAYFRGCRHNGRAEGGFIDYNSGPLATTHGYGWLNGSYERRLMSWFVYARSGGRDIREMTQGASRAFMDNALAYRDTPERMRGLISSPQRDTGPAWSYKFNLPLYWEGSSKYEIATSFNLNQVLFDYYLTGYRRAGDIGKEYAETAREKLTAEDRHSRPIQAVRQVAHAYELTWEPRLRELIYEMNERLLYDPEGAILLTKTRGYGTTYKTQTDHEVFIELWKLLGDPLFYSMARATTKYHWENVMLQINDGGNRCTGEGGYFFWEETKNPAIVSMFDYSRRNLAADQFVINRTTRYPTFNYKDNKILIIGASQSPKFFKGMMLTIDILSQTGAHEKPVASWIAFNTETAPVSLFFNKPGRTNVIDSYDKETALNLLVRRESSHAEFQVTSKPSDFEVGSTVSLRSHAQAARYAWIGQDLNSIRETRREYKNRITEVTAAKDGPAGVYELVINLPGRYSVFADKAVPLSLYAPKGFTAESMHPPVRTYFRVPEGADGAKISFQGETSLYMPDGKPFGDGKQVKGWVELPKGKPGLWSFEGIYTRKVEIENLPGFFAMGDPAFYMEYKEE